MLLFKTLFVILAAISCPTLASATDTIADILKAPRHYTSTAQLAIPVPTIENHTMDKMMGSQYERALTKNELAMSIIAKRLDIEDPDTVQLGVIGLSLLGYAHGKQINLTYSHSF